VTRIQAPSGEPGRVADQLLLAAQALADDCDALSFAEPVSHVYNPLRYAWAPFEQYVRRFAQGPRRVIFLGMNPGPFGMMQIGVPFGEIAAVRDWMGIRAQVTRPRNEHPKRPIDGFDCQRSEVSGRRLWSWAQTRFGTAETFFEQCFVINYCPLVFLEAGGRNFTPDKLPVREARLLEDACDRHLVRCLQALSPSWAIGIGGFAQKRIQTVLQANHLEAHIRVGQILHPSPASPAANRGWVEAVELALARLAVFD
jgi:single-strand selective monofunctional uracil DNA glycosylase